MRVKSTEYLLYHNTTSQGDKHQAGMTLTLRLIGDANTGHLIRAQCLLICFRQITLQFAFPAVFKVTY